MRRDPATDGKSVKRTNKVVPVAISRRATENRKPNVQLPQIRRMYTVQVRVIDPEGQEILNLTKMAFEEDTNNIRKRDVLAVLPVDGDLRDGAVCVHDPFKWTRPVATSAYVTFAEC